MMTNEQIFDKCKRIYTLDGKEKANELFRLLDKIGDKQAYPPVLNHLIREVGIYPYINQDTAIFSDRLVCECFKADVGENEPKILHREQSRILKRLLEGENLILSAPTSFGKSFIIDALIAIKKPSNILIIVPTISLMDETRRRLTLKFGSEYHIITTSGSQLKDKNIFIFPQERALEYFENLREKSLDLFIVDEFYKISSKYDKDRSSILQHTILKYSKIVSQKYYLCPNIDEISQQNIFSEDMEFIPISNNTVFIDIFQSYKENNFNKTSKLFEVLSQNFKTLIYTKSQNEIKNVCDEIMSLKENKVIPKKLLDFSKWLLNHYGEFYLVEALKRFTGIHHGKLHRCLSQIQVKLFEEEDGLKTIVSTSSLIEGINIPAKNLVLWNKLKGNTKLDSFTYRNIIGRSGRMFKYFVGNVYLFEEPPSQDREVLEIEVQVDSMLTDEEIEQELPNDKQEEIKSFKEKMINLVGKEQYNKLRKLPKLKNKKETIIKLVELLKSKDFDINAFKYLLNNEPTQWGLLAKMAKIPIFHIQNAQNLNMVELIKKLSLNWNKDIPYLLNEMSISLDDFFQVENHISFKVSSLFADMNILAQALFFNVVDISPFASKLSNAFLPSVVYTLEEFGLPRMLSKKLHKYNFINFENNDLKIDEVLEIFKKSSVEEIINLFKANNDFDAFDEYILKYFYDGLGK